MPKEKQTLSDVIPSSKKTGAKKSTTVNEDKTALHLLRLAIIAAIVIVFGLAAVAWGTYSEGWQNYFVDSVNKVVPFPAASVGYGNWVSIGDYNKNIKAMRQFLESKEAAYGGGDFDFSTPDGLKRLAIIKKNVLNQLIDSKLVEVIAKQQGISISNQELTETTNKIITRDGKQAENIAQLNTLYGWTTEDFRDGVVKNLLYQQKLEDKIKANGELDRDAQKKLEIVKGKISSGANFSDIAQEFSDSPSKQYGGLLPTFSRDNAPQVLSDAAFRLEIGKVSNPIEADDGWHIVRVEKRATEAGKEKVQISHILIKKKTLKNWLEEKKKEYRIIVLLKSYYWHDQMGKLYFRDDGLNQLEQDINRSYLNETNQQADFLLNTQKSGQ